MTCGLQKRYRADTELDDCVLVRWTRHLYHLVEADPFVDFQTDVFTDDL